METNLDQLKCGQCGEKKHELYRRQNGEIIVECTKCKSRSDITVRQPKIDIGHIDVEDEFGNVKWNAEKRAREIALIYMHDLNTNAFEKSNAGGQI